MLTGTWDERVAPLVDTDPVHTSAWRAWAREQDRRRRQTVAALCASAAVLGLAGNAVAAKQAPIRAVADRTFLVGWPHLATPTEQAAVTRRVRNLYVTRAWYGTARCWTPTGMAGGWVCGVHRADNRPINLDAPTTPKQVVQSFRVTVRVWEDGSYRVTGRRP